MKTTKPILIILLLALHACGPLKEVVTPEVEEISVSRTLAALKAGETSFDFFATRFSGVATIDNSSFNVSGNIRIRKDSAIYVSISPLLGIEMARVLVTPDEVKVINRLDGTYFEGEMGFINNILNTHLDYYMLQAILVGNDFDHFSSDNFRVSVDRGKLLLQNTGRTPKSGNISGLFFQQNLWLDSESFRITENLLYDPLTRRSMRTRYERFDQVTGQHVPREISMTFVDPVTRADLSLRYSRTTIDEPRPITFSVPDRYRPIMGNENH